MKRLVLMSVLGLAIAGAAVAACSNLGQLGDALEPYTPKLHFKELSLQGIDFQHVDVDFVFQIDNPNPLNVKLATFSYALGLEGVEFLKGVNNDGVALKAKGSSELALPVSVRFEDLFKLVGAVDGKDDIAFSLAGDFGFNTPVGVAKVPYKEEGRFPVIHAPDVSLEGIRMGKLDLLSQTATLNLDVGLANDHGGSALSFDAFDYKVDLGASQVAAGLVDSIAAAAPDKKQVVTIPINLNLRSVGAAIVSAVTKKTALDVKLGATVKVGTPFGQVPLSIDETGNLSIR
ncbi:MAG: LEA type 2 family protein [Myxococcales bacterium]|nr:LEA type 2 family protein [Myxococcales bacterium]MCB9734060.1 LEA type 2 family protein [Deltaproteobacteria bacterium]